MATEDSTALKNDPKKVAENPKKRNGCLTVIGCLFVFGLIMYGIMAGVRFFTGAGKLTAKELQSKYGISDDVADDVKAVFDKLGGDPNLVLGFMQNGNAVIMTYDSPMADDYRIAFETSAGKVDTVYVSDKQDNPFYSNGTVNYTFAQGLILSDLEITNALAAAQVRVKNQLKTPDSAKFDLTTAAMTKTWENGEMVYYVEEDFTAKNDLGVDISSSYTAIVKTKDGDTFEGDATISE